eukprot:4930449-Amphidinium_carterae.2
MISSSKSYSIACFVSSGMRYTPVPVDFTAGDDGMFEGGDSSDPSHPIAVEGNVNAHHSAGQMNKSHHEADHNLSLHDIAHPQG